MTLIPGVVTFTATDAAVVEMNPDALAATVVLVPPPPGSNATPPPATLVAELNWAGPMVTVRTWPAPADVTSWPAAALLFVTVTVMPPPARTACSAARFAFPASGGPVRTMNG